MLEAVPLIDLGFILLSRHGCGIATGSHCWGLCLQASAMLLQMLALVLSDLDLQWQHPKGVSCQIQWLWCMSHRPVSWAVFFYLLFHTCSVGKFNVSLSKLLSFSSAFIDELPVNLSSRSYDGESYVCFLFISWNFRSSVLLVQRKFREGLRDHRQPSLAVHDCFVANCIFNILGNICITVFFLLIFNNLPLRVYLQPRWCAKICLSVKS